ncbi:TonB-dependent receptor [Flavobacterium sp. HXWNR69]|uniref:TonB-dependent receptor n=1 Tax=Flavobacterium fragile TaxID=2949085 RepID=A0ABT0TCX7_9FLAO|nr:TonB-dependent receptor [Flavobacterium sp. HXWNR69]MCL9768809.1 TonB-dependent receptor [Flavobacterium sp. HXWNR69]
MKLRLLSMFFFFTAFLFAQKGTVTGVILDKEFNNEPLPFANILVKGTKQGTATDENGKYSISLDPGSYTLIIGYLGYETKEIPFTLKANETIKINHTLAASRVELGDIEIIKIASKEKESALLQEQQKAVEIKQSIGAEEIAKKGISDVASAVAKTTGVSKQEGSGNVYVRGLGDRYNSTSINGLPVPSNDPEKKNIDLGLFSTDIVEYISIDKVYSSRISGDFAGGNVNITSKNYTGKGLLEFSVGSGINTNAVEKNSEFMLQDGPKFLGFTNTNIPSNPLGSYGYQNSLNPVEKTPFAGSLGLKAGKSFQVGEGKLNLFTNIGFSNGYEFREGINQSVSAQDAKLKSFHQTKFAYKTNTTGILSAVYKLNNNHQITYNSLFVNSSEQSRDKYLGSDRDYEEVDLMVIRGTYIQNSLFVNQLLGTHKITDRFNFDWGMSYNTIKSDMPDRTQNKFDSALNANQFSLAQATTTDNHRYFQNLTENETATNLVLSYKFGKNSEDKTNGKLTFGYNGRFKFRDFEAIQFNFPISGAELNTTIDPNNLDQFFNQTNFNNGLFSVSTFNGSTRPQTYNGEQFIHAGYTGVEYEFSDKLSATAGMRFEKVNQKVEWKTQFDAEGASNSFDRNEFLPYAILKYVVNEKQNIRFGASKTYTLPQFKERALFIYEDVTEVKIGNPFLYPSQNFNGDIKWEFFPEKDELISVTAFGKYILDPINEITLASSTNDISFINTGDYGYVMGLELETRKNIFKTNDDDTKLSAGLNVSYMKTDQELNSDKVRNETNYNINLTDSKSGFTGASDLLLNADVTFTKNYKNDSNITGTLAYSYYSDRLYALGVEQKGNLVDKGMGTLDFIFKSKLNKNMGLSFVAKNILNPTFNRVQENTSHDITVLSYKRGANISLGLSYQF